MSKPKELFKEYRVFGLRVKEARKKLGISQRSLAGLMGLTEASIRHVELGRQGVYLRNAIQIANILGFSLSDIQSISAHGDVSLELKRSLIAIKRKQINELEDQINRIQGNYR